MLFSLKKFNKEIATLKSVKSASGLHPLRQEQIKQRVLSEITEVVPLVRVSWFERRRKFAYATILAFVSLGLVGGTAVAANSSNPGDVLYPVKRIAEEAHVAVTVSEQGKASLQAQHAEKRLDELTRIKTDTNNVQPSATQVQVEADAKAEVDTALGALEQVKNKLEAEHHTDAAVDVSNKILRLRARAEQGNVIKKRRGQEGNSGKDKEQEVEGARNKKDGSNNSSGENLGENENENNHNTKLRLDSSLHLK